MDLAASIQKVCEEAMLALAKEARKVTGADDLCMAGGCALNCVGNGLISREKIFKRIFVQPAAGDAGGALGAALMTWHEVLGQGRTPKPTDSQRGSLLGPSFSNDEIEPLLKTYSAPYVRYSDEDFPVAVARLLEQGKVVGFFHGRMEFGPRALGSRSIIGDARRRDMQTVMNVKIKFRESFRPFAPFGRTGPGKVPKTNAGFQLKVRNRPSGTGTVDHSGCDSCRLQRARADRQSRSFRHVLSGVEVFLRIDGLSGHNQYQL
jgi:carbamoyltransferase